MLLTWASSRSRPSLVLNFLQEIADSRITYSGGANGTRVNSSGVIVAATTPRFDYNPVSLAALGLLIEEQRTNLILRAQEFDNASWINFGTIATTANSTIAPDGTTTADTLTDNDAANNAAKLRGAAVPNDSLVRTGSAYFYKTTGALTFPGLQIQYNSGGTATTGSVTVNTNTGVLTNRTGFAPSGGAVIEDAGFFWRVSVSHANNNSGNLQCVLYALPAVNADAGGVWVLGTTGSSIPWGAQLETSSHVSSYIPTTSASVTRTADSAIMTGTNFSSFYNQAGGTLVASFDVITTVAGTRPIVSFDDNTANERIELYASGTDLRMRVIDGGATQVDMSIGTIAANTTYKAAISFAANDFAGCVNGGTVATDTSGTLPTPDRMRLGSNQAGNYQNGHLRSITYYPTARPNSLQALTA